MPKDNPGWWSRNVNRVAHPEEQSPEQAKRAPWVLVAFVALVVIVAVGVWALRVFWFEPSQTAGPTPRPSSSPSVVETTAPPAPNGTGACTLDNAERDISTTPPKATQWVIERWAAVPVVEGAGPCTEQGGYRVGFAHTQTGALLASYHYFVHGIPASPDSGTKGLLEYALLDGYKIQSFAGDSAVVELMLSNASTAGSITIKLVWKDGDWRIDPASADAWGTTQKNVRAQSFVPWSSRTGN